MKLFEEPVRIKCSSCKVIKDSQPIFPAPKCTWISCIIYISFSVQFQAIWPNRSFLIFLHGRSLRKVSFEEFPISKTLLLKSLMTIFRYPMTFADPVGRFPARYFGPTFKLSWFLPQSSESVFKMHTYIHEAIAKDATEFACSWKIFFMGKILFDIEECSCLCKEKKTWPGVNEEFLMRSLWKSWEHIISL